MKALEATRLRANSLAALGIRIDALELTCDLCGDQFKTPWSLPSGRFRRDWYECPRGCNSGKGRKVA